MSKVKSRMSKVRNVLGGLDFRLDRPRKGWSATAFPTTRGEGEAAQGSQRKPAGQFDPRTAAQAKAGKLGRPVAHLRAERRRNGVGRDRAGGGVEQAGPAGRVDIVR